MGIWVLYAYIYICYWPWLYIGRGYIVLEHSTHLVFSNWIIIFSQKHLPGVLKQKYFFGGEFFSLLNFFFKNVPGVLKRMQIFYFFRRGGGFWGVWGSPRPHPGVARGRKTILLPMTMTCDQLKFWSGPAWRSKVIIRKPWRRKKTKQKKRKKKRKKFWQNHKAFPAGSRECLMMTKSVIRSSWSQVKLCLKSLI